MTILAGSPDAAAATGLVDRARALAPGLRERVVATEQRRSLPIETVAEMREAGLWRILQPRRFGGFEAGFDVVHAVTIELGRACASTAWCTMIFNTGTMVASFPEQAQEDVWGATPDVPVGGVFAPSPDTKAVDGGYTIEGRWPFASGVDHAGWMMLAGLLIPGEGAPDFKFMLVPATDFRIEDDWFVSGLRGTGSKTLVIDDPVFVPEHRTISFAGLREGDSPGGRLHPNPLYRIPIAASFPSGGVGTAIGIASAALEAWREWTSTRVVHGVQRVADWPATQMRLAESAAEIDAAGMLIDRNLADAQRIAAEQGTVPVPVRARIQRDAAYAAKLVVDAVDRLFEASGGSGLHDAHPVQRAWRDVHAVAAHISLRWDSAAEHYGRIAFGKPPGNPYFY